MYSPVQLANHGADTILQGRKTIVVEKSRRWLQTLTAEGDISHSSGLHETYPDGTQLISPPSRSEVTKRTPVAGDYHVIQRQSESPLYTRRHVSTQLIVLEGKQTKQLGATIGSHYQPHTLLTHPPSPQDITLELLLASQSHLGHSTSLWHPANSRYIFGIRQGIHIISLDVTAAYLRRACKIVSEVTERGGLILFVGTRGGQDRCVVNAAKLAGGCHLFERWIPGSITNGQQILGQCRLKVVDENDRELQGFGHQVMDRAALKPDLVVCLNPLENYVLLHECGLNNIPTIGIIDTDANPTWVTYPIPANDDSMRCVHVIAGVLGKAGEQGRIRRKEKAERGELTVISTPGIYERDRSRSEGTQPPDPASESDS